MDGRAITLTTTTMATFQTIRDFLYYVQHIRVLVEHTFGTIHAPSLVLETVPGYTPVEPVIAPLLSSIPSHMTRAYHSLFTTCLDNVIAHLEAVMNASEDADDANMTQEMRTYHEFHEQAVVFLYTPIVSHTLGSVTMLGHLIALFESYYRDLVAYDRAYVTAYRATLQNLVGALMMLREADADEYYRVVHEFSMQEYYGVLGGIEKGLPLGRFRTALDAAAAVVTNENAVEIAASYQSFLQLHGRTTYLTDLMRDLARVQRLIGTSWAKKN